PDIALRGSCAYAIVIFPALYWFRHSGWLSPSSAFLVQGIAAAIASVVLARGCKAIQPLQGGALHTFEVLKIHWAYGKWVVATAAGYWLTTAAYYLFVGVLLPLERVAELRALQNLSMPINQFMAAQTNLMLPVASARFADYGAAA